MDSFKALRVHRLDGQVQPRYEQIGLGDLTEGEVVIRTAYSSLNYKDALALTGRGNILRRYPLVAGIDLAGIVESSSDERFASGDRVVVVGEDLAVNRDGGYAEFARMPADLVKKAPEGMTLLECMALGTAGAAAAAAIDRLEHNGQRPGNGPVVVTGATGGVGSLAIDILSGRGYEVVALTSKTTADSYLRSLGASRILRLSEVDFSGPALGAAQWGGAVDNLGGEVLSWLLRTVRPLGNVVSVGLASDAALTTTVMPFIIRGVCLLGINSSVTAGLMERSPLERLASDLKPRHIEKITSRTIEFDEILAVIEGYIDNKNVGRTIVKIADLE